MSADAQGTQKDRLIQGGRRAPNPDEPVLTYRTYAVGRTRLEGANAMSRAAGVDWGSLHLQPAPRRLDHGVAPLSYDAAALRPRGRCAAGLARRVGRRRPAHAVRPAGPVRDGLAPARCPADAAAHRRAAARAPARS